MDKTGSSPAAEEAPILKATHAGEIGLGGVNVPCYVLGDGRRVITNQGAIEALGMSRGGSGGGGTRLANFVSGRGLKPYFPSTFDYGMKPVRFQTTSGSPANGYPALILADICEAVLSARDAGRLWRAAGTGRGGCLDGRDGGGRRHCGMSS